MNEFVDAIEFIFNEHESPAGGAQVGGLANMWELTWEHLQLSGVSIGDRVRARRSRWGSGSATSGKGGFLAINASNVGRAVPSLALIAFFVAYIGVGFTNLTLALVLLAIPPILTNTYTGVRQVDRDTVDSARGMGMTGTQVVRRVELPLALPLIFGGVRISAVNVVATATIAPLAGVVDARRPDHQREHLRRRGQARGGPRRRPAGGRHGAGPGSRAARGDPAGTEAGGRQPLAPPGIRNAQQQKGSPHMRRHRWLMLLALLVAALAVAGCGDDDDDEWWRRCRHARASSPRRRSRRTTRTRRPRSRSARRTSPSRRCSGRSTPRRSAAAGYTVKKDLNLGDEKTQLKALENGDIDADPEYTGTALLSLFGVHCRQAADAILSKAYEEAKERLTRRRT